MLLTVADVGSGYSATLVQGGITGTELIACTTLNNNPAGTGPNAAIALVNKTTGAAVGEALFQVKSSDVGADMTAYADVPQDCPAFTGTIDGATFSFTTQPLSVASLGDQTTAIRITASFTAGGTVYSIYLDYVFIQHQDTIIAVLVSTPVNTPPDITVTESAVSAAYKKIPAHW